MCLDWRTDVFVGKFVNSYCLSFLMKRIIIIILLPVLEFSLINQFSHKRTIVGQQIHPNMAIL